MLDFLTRPLIAPEAARLLEVGIEELPASRLMQLVDDLVRAQDQLLGAAFRAAMNSSRVEAICPDTPEDMLNPTLHAFRIRKDS